MKAMRISLYIGILYFEHVVVRETMAEIGHLDIKAIKLKHIS